MLTPPRITVALKRVRRNKPAFPVRTRMRMKPSRPTVMRPKARNDPMTDLSASARPAVVPRLMVPTRPIPVAERSMAIAPSFLFITYSVTEESVDVVCDMAVVSPEFSPGVRGRAQLHC